VTAVVAVAELVCGRLVTGEKGDNRAVEGVADGMAVISGTSDILAGDGVTPKPDGTPSGKEKGEAALLDNESVNGTRVVSLRDTRKRKVREFSEN